MSISSIPGQIVYNLIAAFDRDKESVDLSRNGYVVDCFHSEMSRAHEIACCLKPLAKMACCNKYLNNLAKTYTFEFLSYVKKVEKTGLIQRYFQFSVCQKILTVYFKIRPQSVLTRYDKQHPKDNVLHSVLRYNGDAKLLEALLHINLRNQFNLLSDENCDGETPLEACFKANVTFQAPAFFTNMKVMKKHGHHITYEFVVNTLLRSDYVKRLKLINQLEQHHLITDLRQPLSRNRIVAPASSKCQRVINIIIKIFLVLFSFSMALMFAHVAFLAAISHVSIIKALAGSAIFLGFSIFWTWAGIRLYKIR